MAIKRTITKELNIQTICNTANTFSICRGDSVDFTFTFKNGAEAFDISTATKARVFAKKIKYDGVNLLEAPLFSKEIELSNATQVEASFTPEETAGEQGNYLLSVVLLDADANTITAQTIPFTLFNQGYTGTHQVTESFRDEVLELATKLEGYVDTVESALAYAQAPITNLTFTTSDGKAVKVVAIVKDGVPMLIPSTEE